MRLPVNPGLFARAGASFRPLGECTVCGRRPNPAAPLPDDAYAARLFVGFNVRGVPTHTIATLIELVKIIRREQGAPPDATFLAQMGLFTGKAGKTETEDGAQVIIFDMAGLSKQAFLDQMTYLGERLAGELEQEAVILELQKGGISQGSFWVTPR